MTGGVAPSCWGRESGDGAAKRADHTKEPAEKLARQRLTVRQLAEVLGDGSAACRRAGMDRTSFYGWKRRFQTHGLSGLKDLPPVHRTHPQTPGGRVAGAGAVDDAPNPGCGGSRTI